MSKRLMILFSVSLIMLLLIGCVGTYKYFPAEPQWAPGAAVLADTNGNYLVNSQFVTNYVYQKTYLEDISNWRKNNGVP